MIATPIFRYDDASHSYFINEDRVPSITQLLSLGGLVAAADYYTEASRQRGTEVHRLTFDYDLGALPKPKALDSPFRGYLLGYVAACDALKPAWEQIEIADTHPLLRFAGRVDRVGGVFGRMTVCEIKSAVKAKHHAIQTALQAILKSGSSYPAMPAERWQRLTIYVKPSGKFSIDEHTDPRDFDVAKDLIRRFCG